MGRQLLDGDWPCRFGLDLAVLFSEVDLHLRELRQVLRDRIGHQEVPLLEEHHHGGAGDGLGLRVEAEDGVPLHREPGLDVAQAGRLEMHDLPLPGDEGDRSRNMAGVDQPAEALADPLQALARHADALGFGYRHAAGVGAGGRRGRKCREKRRAQPREAGDGESGGHVGLPGVSR